MPQSLSKVYIRIAFQQKHIQHVTQKKSRKSY